MIAVSFITGIYYDIIIVWATYYLFVSLSGNLRWEKCDFDDWADYRCEMLRIDCLPGSEHVRGFDGLCYNATASGITNFTYSHREIVPSYMLHNVTKNLKTIFGVWNETLAEENGISQEMASAQFYTYI